MTTEAMAHRRQRLGWFKVLGAEVVATGVTLYANLLVRFLFPLPDAVTRPLAGFAMGLITVLPGAILAPRNPLAVAIALGLAVTLPTALLLHFHLPGCLLGSTVAAAAAEAWFRHRRGPNRTSWPWRAACGLGVTLLTCFGILLGRAVDWPPRPSAVPSDLAEDLGTNSARISRFHRYDRGGFLDREYLWRIDAPREVADAMVRALRLRHTSDVPPQFWKMAPYYWPRSMPAGGLAFQSTNFTATERGPDGRHVLLIYDPEIERAFAWVKDNF